MRTSRVQTVLSFLSLLGAVLGSDAPSSSSSLDSCSVQAWVRAPDLAPDTIVQGDARVKLSAGCTPVDTLSLGLRFKERAFAKTAREEKVAKRSIKNDILLDIFDPERMSPASPWVVPATDSVNCSENIANEEIVKNKHLWSLREEERIVFESTQHMAMGADDHPQGTVRDIIRDFALLVPSTNFPPALDYLSPRMMLREREFVNVESMYEYFVRVTFINGTTNEVPAGFTAFQPLYTSLTSKGLTYETAELQTKASLNGSLVESSPVANYTIEVSDASGLTFSQGSKNQLVAVSVTRTGLARTFTTPLKVHLCMDSHLSAKWASSHTSDPNLQPIAKPNQILRATSDDFKDTPSGPSSGASFRCSPFGPGHSVPLPIHMSNATSSEINAGEIVTTTSDAVVIPIDVDPRQTIDFETYYQKISNTLGLSIDIPRTQDEAMDPTDFLDMRALRKKVPEFEEDEAAWVPWQKVPEVTRSRGARTYTANVPVSVRPGGGRHLPKGCARAGANVVGSGQAMLADEVGCERHTVVHYLAEDARAPTFVDVGAVDELHAKAPAERDLLAPFLVPVVSSPPEGEELVHRYYRTADRARPFIYVGETWVKKVAHTDEHTVTTSRQDDMSSKMLSMAQAMRRIMDEL